MGAYFFHTHPWLNAAFDETKFLKLKPPYCNTGALLNFFCCNVSILCQDLSPHPCGLLLQIFTFLQTFMQFSRKNSHFFLMIPRLWRDRNLKFFSRPRENTAWSVKIIFHYKVAQKLKVFVRKEIP